MLLPPGSAARAGAEATSAASRSQRSDTRPNGWFSEPGCGQWRHHCRSGGETAGATWSCRSAAGRSPPWVDSEGVKPPGAVDDRARAHPYGW